MSAGAQVMDMTATSFADGAFGLVLDKGGLDALMGEGDAGSLEAGGKLLREVERLLRPGAGTYVCVTLAQEHVLGMRPIRCIRVITHGSSSSATAGRRWLNCPHRCRYAAGMMARPTSTKLLAVILLRRRATICSG